MASAHQQLKSEYSNFPGADPSVLKTGNLELHKLFTTCLWFKNLDIIPVAWSLRDSGILTQKTSNLLNEIRSGEQYDMHFWIAGLPTDALTAIPQNQAIRLSSPDNKTHLLYKAASESEQASWFYHFHRFHKEMSEKEFMNSVALNKKVAEYVNNIIESAVQESRI